MPEPLVRQFAPSAGVPNNARLPVLLYRAALPADAAAIEAHINGNGWECRWRNGIYDFHHFHTTAHETVAVARGTARMRLGGEDGEDVALAAGDAVVLPAGTGHKCLDASADFLTVGAYPPGQDYEVERPAAADIEAMARRVSQVPLPAGDPVAGKDGALARLWRR